MICYANVFLIHNVSCMFEFIVVLMYVLNYRNTN